MWKLENLLLNCMYAFLSFFLSFSLSFPRAKIPNISPPCAPPDFRSIKRILYTTLWRTHSCTRADTCPAFRRTIIMSISTIDVRCCSLARQPWAPCSSFCLPSPLDPFPPPSSPRPAATCMIFRLGMRTCEPRLRAFIICFYAYSSEGDLANTWISISHLANRMIGHGREQRRKPERSRKRER